MHPIEDTNSFSLVLSGFCDVFDNKLVRDKIPEIIEADGKVCRTHILSNEGWGSCLRRRFL